MKTVGLGIWLGGAVGLLLLLMALTEENWTVILIGEGVWAIASAMFALAEWRANRKP